MIEVRKPNQIGHVIRILDKYTLLVDVGASKLSVGDTVQVYEIGDIIKDLNGNPLSYFVHIKDELEVIQTEERYSLCKKNKTLVKKFPSVLATSPMLEHSFTERIPLKVDESELQPFNPGDNIIHVGDAVKLA